MVTGADFSEIEEIEPAKFIDVLENKSNIIVSI